jgi:hypothetical protein
MGKQAAKAGNNSGKGKGKRAEGATSLDEAMDDCASEMNAQSGVATPGTSKSATGEVEAAQDEGGVPSELYKRRAEKARVEKEKAEKELTELKRKYEELQQGLASPVSRHKNLIR